MKTFLLILLLVIMPNILCAQPGYIEVTAPGNRQLKLAVVSPRSSDVPANSELSFL